MIVQVEVQGTVYWFHHHRQFQLILPEGAEVRHALEAAGFDLTGREQVQLNGRAVALNQPLAEGDRLLVMADPTYEDDPGGTLAKE